MAMVDANKGEMKDENKKEPSLIDKAFSWVTDKAIPAISGAFDKGIKVAESVDTLKNKKEEFSRAWGGSSTPSASASSPILPLALVGGGAFILSKLI